MRLTTLILITGILQVSASSYAQKISLSERNANLTEVLNQIRTQTGYDFFFESVNLKSLKNISIKAQKEELKTVLNRMLDPQNLTYSIRDKAIIIKEKEASLLIKAQSAILKLIQDITATGRVVDEKAAPLVGANVRIKGTNKGAKTNENGIFTLKGVDEDTVLEISYIGYKIREVKASMKLENIALEISTDDLEEVNVMVSTGYQTLPKERATGSFVQIDNNLLNRSVSTDILSRLDGVTSSLLFDRRDKENTKLQIRGISTVFASPQPLIILDNFPYEGDINNINPNDVEAVTVLKDAAAASIWGARAGNGVIVITTKKGRYNQPLQISINTNFTLAPKPDLFNIPEMSTSDYISAQRYLFNNNFYDDDLNDAQTYPPLGEIVELLSKQRNLPSTDVQARALIDEQINELQRYDVRNDFEKYIYQTSVNQQHSLSISSGTENAKYMIAAGYDRNIPQLKGNASERLTLRFNHSQTLLKNLELQTNIAFTRSSSQMNSTGGYFGNYNIGSRNIYPYSRFATDDGLPLAIERNLRKSFIDGTLSNGLLDWSYKPLDELNLSDNSNIGQDIRINTAAVYKLSSAFQFELRYQYGSYSVNGKNYHNSESYFTRDLINRFTDVSSGKMIRNIPLGGILDESTARLTENSIRGQLNFNTQWGKNHQLSAIAGIEARQTNTENRTFRNYGYDDDRLTYLPVDYLKEYPSYNNMFGSSRIDGNINFGSLLNRFFSFYTNAAYSYKNRYTLSVSARKDASNLFGVEANRKGVPLWSTGVSWNISDEPFYKLNLIPVLRARLTYGYSGNLPTDQSALTIISYAPATDNSVSLPFANITNPPNPLLRWEKVGMINAGIDFGIIGNRISGSIEYFSKDVKDMLGNETTDATKGFGGIVTNSANMTGQGIDISLSSINTAGNFKWRSTLLFSYVTNKLTKYLSQPSLYANAYIGDGNALISLQDKMPYMVISYKWTGLDGQNGNPQGIYNGQTSSDYYNITNNTLLTDAVFHGSPLPLYFGSIRNGISWKNWSVSVNVGYKFDYYFRRSTIGYYTFGNLGRGHSDFGKRWQNPGDEKNTTVPSFTYPLDVYRDAFYVNSAATVDRGDNIKIQDFQMDYTINGNLNKQNFFRQIQLYSYINNLNFLIWRANKSGIDPDFINGLKTPTSFSLGLKATF